MAELLRTSKSHEHSPAQKATFSGRENGPNHSIGFDSVSFDRSSLFAKRGIDIVIASLFLLMLLPLLLVIAILVRTTSRGPVIFKQERVGKNQSTFRIFKFRTLHNDTPAMLLADSDLYVSYVENGYKLSSTCHFFTPVGRFLRKTSLDELPQLFNVLLGDMSIVGVRPLLVEELRRRSPSDQFLYGVLPPGVTGLWQVSGRNSLSNSEREAIDRLYLSTWSLGLDLQILLRTPKAVLQTDSTS